MPPRNCAFILIVSLLLWVLIIGAAIWGLDVWNSRDHRERRRRKRSNTVVTAAKCRPTVTSGRICINCGNWIRRVDLIYQGRNYGRGWIHFKSKGMGERKYLWTIERCIAEPRPIPPVSDTV
jgi:hypothetical protein